GIWHEEAAGAAQGRLGVAQETMVGIVAGARPVRVRVEMRGGRVEFAEPDDRRANHHPRAGSAGRVHLPRGIDALHEGDELVGPDLRASRRIWTDDRRMRDGYASELELACRVLDPASHARIVLRKGRDRQQMEQANQRHRPKRKWTDHWALLGD